VDNLVGGSMVAVFSKYAMTIKVINCFIKFI
jgi:hypothetical protein